MKASAAEKETALAVKTNDDALARLVNTELVAPDYIKKDDTRGTENIRAKDVRQPSLRLAQSLTPETKRSESAYIDGLREGELFNSMSKVNYGEGPLHLIIVNQLGERHVEFKPLSEGGGVIDPRVPDGDPRTKFTVAVKDGVEVRVKPRATRYYDYLILLLRPGQRPEGMTFSLKGTQLKKAMELNGRLVELAGRGMASFAQVFKLEVMPERKGQFNFYGLKFTPAGWATAENYAEAEAFYEAMRDKKAEDVVDDNANAADAAETDEFAPEGKSRF